MLLVIALSALGVVYGDLGTSPLYALRETFHGHHAIPVTSTNVFGVLSLTFWSLMLVVTIKYLVFVLRADNRGFNVGLECSPASATCAPTPPGVHALMVLLRKLIEQQLADPSCAGFKN